MYINNQIFFILGISRSGYSASKYIIDRGGKCYIYDDTDSKKSMSAITELVNLGAIKVGDENAEKIIDLCDIIVISPGVKINHKLAMYARSKEKKIMGELEFGFSCFIPPMVAITGTNGKTTTVSLLKCIFDTASCNNELVGNVGIPISSKINEIKKDTICVVEVSSFQLESVADFKPHVSCILNIAPDHLERHFTMDNYIFLKKRIFKNQTESEYTILNYDDEIVKEFSSETRAKVIYVSTKDKVNGAYCLEGRLYYFDEYIMDEKDLSLKGEHNTYNSLFALAVAKLFGVNSAEIKKALEEFRGVSHRIETVGVINGVKYIDDSKATNTSSTITAIKSMDSPTILLLGGSEKGEKYDELFNEIKRGNVKHTFIYGASKLNMMECASRVGLSNYTVVDNFESAVNFSKKFANIGDTVLLSPACASFDEFSNFEERGDKFKLLVGVDVDKL
ncbi:MAG: UDP-N-acetylmuramoyl-L-alanine--D-glutamate ligase [Clostridia bacterium]|nr:UDP-N-acetylmuramoyl-L-alanine--D-glutamate ligase [Clostridia bacterium]